MIEQPGDVQNTRATVTVTRINGTAHCITADLPNGQKVPLFLDTIQAGGTKTAFIQWADYNLNRPATPIEELVDDFQRAVYEETVNRATYSMAKSTVEEDKARLLAAIAHIQANHDEMVARNKVLRTRPDLPQECGHPKQCIGKVHEEDESEKEHCLWCGDIADMAMLFEHCSTIYSSVTDGRISKPNTLPEEVIAVAADLETERTDAAVKDAVADNGDSYRDHLYEDQRHIVPYTGEIEPGATVTIYWKPIPGEVGGRTVDDGYVFVYPHEDVDVGACVHIPHPDPRGDSDVSPEWPTVNDLLANVLIEHIEFKPPVEGCPLAALGCPLAALTTSTDERYAREVELIQRLDKLGVLRIQRGLLASEIHYAYQELSKGKAA